MDVINFRTYYQSTSCIKSATAKKGKNDGKSEVQKFDNLKDKIIFFGRTKAFLMIF